MNLISLLVACGANPPEPPPAAPAEAPAAVATPAAPPAPTGNGPFGVAPDAAKAVPVDTVVADAAAWSGKDVTVKGTVREVCQKKGCWHRLSTADANVDILVKDKEYQIFLPKDAGGRTALVQGTFLVEEMPMDEAKHYAEDAGRDPSTITGPVKTFQIDAAGVLLL